MPSPAQHAALARLAESLAAAPHGGRGALIAQAAAALGVCPATVQAWLRGHRGPRAASTPTAWRAWWRNEQEQARAGPPGGRGRGRRPTPRRWRTPSPPERPSPRPRPI